MPRKLKISVGKPMPDLALKTLDGQPTSLYKQLRPGRRALINVWATWCAPCILEMPELEKLRPQLSASGVDLIGLNVDTEPDANVRDFVADVGVRYPIYIGGIPAVEQLYASDELSVPLSVLLDENGAVAEVIPGWSEETRRRFSALAGSQASDGP